MLIKILKENKNRPKKEEIRKLDLLIQKRNNEYEILKNRYEPKFGTYSLSKLFDLIEKYTEMEVIFYEI